MAERFPKPTVSMDLARMVLDPEHQPPLPASIIKDVPTSPTALLAGPQLPLTLRDVLFTTLSNNLDIRIEELSRQIARSDIEANKGIYDLLARISSSFEHGVRGTRTYNSSTQTGSNDFGPTGQISNSRAQSLTTTRDAALEASLSQLLPSGGTLSLAYSLLRSVADTNSLTNSASQVTNLIGGVNFSSQSTTAARSKSVSYIRALTLGFVQPLLKGFGPEVTNAPIRIAKNNSEISFEAFRSQVMNQLASALKAYWDLVFAVNNYDVQKLSLAQAQDLLRINKIKFETGVRPKTDVLQAQAQVAARQEDVIRAQQSIQDVMDVLKISMNLPHSGADWKAQFIPTQKPGFFEVSYDEGRSIEDALGKRPEARQATLRQANNEIDRAVAKNSLKPSLNVSGSVGYVSPDKEKDYGADNYAVGVEFEYPLQNRTARAQFQQALAQMQLGEADIERIQQSIAQQVRSSLRQVNTSRERIDITRTGVEFETAKLEAEKTRYDVGISTSFQVLEFQKDFAAAQVAFLQAVVDYNKALIDFEAARGTLLETFRIEIPEYGVSIAEGQSSPLAPNGHNGSPGGDPVVIKDN